MERAMGFEPTTSALANQLDPSCPPQYQQLIRTAPRESVLSTALRETYLAPRLHRIVVKRASAYTALRSNVIFWHSY